MSELENKTEEAPKRKRLTKEEREAAIANGTLKPRPRRTKKTEEAPKRKRLTKEEREAAIANGTLKPRPRRTKKTEDGEDKQEVKELNASHFEIH